MYLNKKNGKSYNGNDNYNEKYNSNGIIKGTWKFSPNEEQIIRFKELQRKSLKFCDIVLNKIIYFDNKKYVVNSKCLVNYLNIPYFKINEIEKKGNNSKINKDFFLGDYNIVGGGYNLNRRFYNMEDSLEYNKLKVLFFTQSRFLHKTN